MFEFGRYLFKRAETASEFEQIHALNYSTFVREIPQHADCGHSRLVDKFHAKNLYFVALRTERVVGMVSAHDQPPFSIAGRLPDPGVLSAPAVHPLEIRLLAIEPQERRGIVLGGLFLTVYQYIQGGRHTHLFISGLEDRVKLYLRLGFEVLGPAVGPPQARYVPMGMSVAHMEKHNSRLARLCQGRLAGR